MDTAKPQWPPHILDALKWYFKLLRTEYSKRSRAGFIRWIEADRAHLRAFLFVAPALQEGAKRGAAKRSPLPSSKP
jgi:ferric-dicitrate binding protein FerR (iron transport regulator)